MLEVPEWLLTQTVAGVAIVLFIATVGWNQYGTPNGAPANEPAVAAADGERTTNEKRATDGEQQRGEREQGHSTARNSAQNAEAEDEFHDFLESPAGAPPRALAGQQQSRDAAAPAGAAGLTPLRTQGDWRGTTGAQNVSSEDGDVSRDEFKTPTRSPGDSLTDRLFAAAAPVGAALGLTSAAESGSGAGDAAERNVQGTASKGADSKPAPEKPVQARDTTAPGPPHPVKLRDDTPEYPVKLRESDPTSAKPGSPEDAFFDAQPSVASSAKRDGATPAVVSEPIDDRFGLEPLKADGRNAAKATSSSKVSGGNPQTAPEAAKPRSGAATKGAAAGGELPKTDRLNVALHTAPKPFPSSETEGGSHALAPADAAPAETGGRSATAGAHALPRADPLAAFKADPEAELKPATGAHAQPTPSNGANTRPNPRSSAGPTLQLRSEPKFDPKVLPKFDPKVQPQSERQAPVPEARSASSTATVPAAALAAAAVAKASQATESNVPKVAEPIPLRSEPKVDPKVLPKVNPQPQSQPKTKAAPGAAAQAGPQAAHTPVQPIPLRAEPNVEPKLLPKVNPQGAPHDATQASRGATSQPARPISLRTEPKVDPKLLPKFNPETPKAAPSDLQKAAPRPVPEAPKVEAKALPRADPQLKPGTKAAPVVQAKPLAEPRTGAGPAITANEAKAKVSQATSNATKAATGDSLEYKPAANSNAGPEVPDTFVPKVFEAKPGAAKNFAANAPAAAASTKPAASATTSAGPTKPTGPVKPAASAAATKAAAPATPVAAAAPVPAPSVPQPATRDAAPHVLEAPAKALDSPAKVAGAVLGATSAAAVAVAATTVDAVAHAASGVQAAAVGSQPGATHQVHNPSPDTREAGSAAAVSGRTTVAGKGSPAGNLRPERLDSRQPKDVADTMSDKVFQLRLRDGIPLTPPGQIIVLPVPAEPYTLRLLISSTSLTARKGVLQTNYPPEDQDFVREKFYDHPLGDRNLHRDTHVDVPIHRSGTFTVRMRYLRPTGTFAEPREEEAVTDEWHFIVDTSFHLNGRYLTANALTVQTVLSKLMGPVADWDDKLAYIASKGYNTVHFVPLQHRGESDSPFSIYDQLAWDPAVFPGGEGDVSALVSKMHKKYGLLSISDIVLNHTANNSAWLKDHPEAGYSAKTAPHLQAPLALENAILDYSQRLGDEGVELNTPEDVDRAVEGIKEHGFSKVKLWEFYVVDVEGLAAKADASPFEGEHPKHPPTTLAELAEALVAKGAKNFDRLGPRHARTVDIAALKEFAAGSAFSARQLLDAVNVRLYAEYDADTAKILEQLKSRQKFLRFDSNGPKIGHKLSFDNALAEHYFTRVKLDDGSIVELVNNGWVWGGNPLVDFASPESKAYMVRDVIIWGDCVKLRYGKGPEDNPYVWKRMGDYCRLLAKHFDGLRIDNAHSTPLLVGQYMLDQARLVRPDLYVVAELFTGSQDLDKTFVERWGITSLLREAIQPSNPKDLSTQININGGLPIGSFIPGDVYQNSNIVEVRPRATHSWLMEATHDNETFAQKRTAEDTLSTAALVATCLVSSGTAMGSDELYPTSLDIVSETRPYVFGGGIADAKKVLNAMHIDLADIGATESYTHLEGQYITVHRLNPETGEGYFVVARTKFWQDGDQKLEDTFLEKTRAQWHAGWKLVVNSTEDRETTEKIVPLDAKLEELAPWHVDFEDKSSTIRSPEGADFPQGSVAVFKTTRTFDPTKIERLVREGQGEAVKELDLLDLNVLLYHCDPEERTSTDNSFGTYSLPKYGNLMFAGLQGWEKLALQIVIDNDLGHPLCDNLREGLWAFDYLADRLQNYVDTRHQNNLKPVIAWLRERNQAVSEVPSFLRPRYFCAIVLGLYQAAVHRVLSQMPEHLSIADFTKRLALTSVQMVGKIYNVSLVPNRQLATMAAGLPHFSDGIMRCWGRDVFLSIGGLLLETHRYHEAKHHILSFASTLKHGLIPNLLDSGRNPRYNARDAVWFFVQSVQQYCTVAGSHDILNEKVKRRFPLDDRFVEYHSHEAYQHESTLGEIVYEVLARHAKGIEFREHNAGPNIDSQMNSNGFNQKIWVDWETGFVHGGNQDNCGTWMDKMGESELAGNKGVPGTPRDGAAVEITGLLKSCLRWVNQLRKQGKYAFPQYARNQHGDEFDLEHWERLIQDNFERCYYVPTDPSQDAHFDVDSNIINRRGIYKDLYKSGKPYEDYQLRPNFAVAMVTAPELFTVERAVGALDIADRVIRKPYGMATLDPSDLNYRPNYENSVDSTDFATSKGRNYHQGPEWLWCTGVFLQAMVIFSRRRNDGAAEAYGIIRERIQGLVQWLRASPWSGLTELTNENGAFCQDSSPTQAWSGARVIELLAELARTGEP